MKEFLNDPELNAGVPALASIIESCFMAGYAKAYERVLKERVAVSFERAMANDLVKYTQLSTTLPTRDQKRFAKTVSEYIKFLVDEIEMDNLNRDEGNTEDRYHR